MNYDPNMTTCGLSAKQTVELTFQQWEYFKTMTATVAGNATGLSVIKCAVDIALEELGGENGRIVLQKPNGDTLECELWEHDLPSMLVGARITEIVAAGTVEEMLSRRR